MRRGDFTWTHGVSFSTLPQFILRKIRPYSLYAIISLSIARFFGVRAAVVHGPDDRRFLSDERRTRAHNAWRQNGRRRRVRPHCASTAENRHTVHTYTRCVSHFSSFIVKSGGHLRAIKTPTLALCRFHFSRETSRGSQRPSWNLQLNYFCQNIGRPGPCPYRNECPATNARCEF